MSHALIRDSGRAACTCGNWWTKAWTTTNPAIEADYQRHANRSKP